MQSAHFQKICPQNISCVVYCTNISWFSVVVLHIGACAIKFSNLVIICSLLNLIFPAYIVNKYFSEEYCHFAPFSKKALLLSWIWGHEFQLMQLGFLHFHGIDSTLRAQWVVGFNCYSRYSIPPLLSTNDVLLCNPCIWPSLFKEWLHQPTTNGIKEDWHYLHSLQEVDFISIYWPFGLSASESTLRAAWCLGCPTAICWPSASKCTDFCITLW